MRKLDSHRNIFPRRVLEALIEDMLARFSSDRPGPTIRRGRNDLVRPPITIDVGDRRTSALVDVDTAMGMRAKLTTKAVIRTVPRGDSHGTEHWALDEFVLELKLKCVIEF